MNLVDVCNSLALGAGGAIIVHLVGNFDFLKRKFGKELSSDACRYTCIKCTKVFYSLNSSKPRAVKDLHTKDIYALCNECFSDIY